MARAIGAGLALTLGLAVALGMLAHARLRQGPIDLQPLAGLVERAAARELDADMRLTVRGAALSLGDERDPRPGLRLSGLRLTDPEGRTLFAAPTVRVEFRPLDLLLGRLRPTALTISDAAGRLSRDAAGRFRMGVYPEGALHPSDPEAEAEAAEAAYEGLAALLGDMASDSGPLASLRSVSMVGARIVYVDDAARRVWSAERADLSLSRDDEGVFRAVASLALPEGGLGPVFVRIAAQTGPDDRTVALRLGFTGVSPRDLVAQFPALGGLEAVDAPLQGRVSAQVDLDGALVSLDAALRAAPGFLSAAGLRLSLRGAALDFGYDPAASRFDVRRLEVAADRGAVRASGVAIVPRDAADAATEALAQLDIDALAVTDPGLFETPQSFDAGGLTLRARFDPLRIEVSDAWLQQGPTQVQARIDAERRGDAWSATLALTGRDVTAERLTALWPIGPAQGARGWIADNITAATVDRFDLFYRLEAPEDGDETEDFGVTFAFRGVDSYYLRPLPPIRGASGWAQATLDRFDLVLDAGAGLTQAGALQLAGSHVSLPDLRPAIPRADIVVSAQGPVAAALDLLDAPPLELLTAADIDLGPVEGDATATVRLSMPLAADLAMDEVAVAVDAALTGLQATAPGLGAPLTADALRLRADAASLNVQGDARVGGIAASIDWTETFGPAAGAPRSAASVRTRLTPAQLASLGADLRPYVDGPVGVTGALTRGEVNGTGFDLTIDLTDAAMDGGPLDWRKRPGARATAQLRGSHRPDGLRVDRLNLQAPGLAVAGSAGLTSDGALSALDLSRATLGDRADLALTLRREGAGWAARVRGELLDIALLAEREAPATGPAARTQTTPIAVELTLDRLLLDERLALSRVDGRAAVAADGAVTAALTAAEGGGASIAYAEVGADRTARIAASDAGAFLRDMGLFSDGLGGRLEIDARLLDGGAVSGELRASGLTVADDPAFRRLLAEGRLPEVPPEALAEGLRFDTVRAPFVLTDGVLSVREAVAFGPTVGISISGAYDLGRDRLEMTGVFTPAYAVNAAIGAIPLLGDLLTGGVGRGVVAVNFRLTGPASDPQVSVNPLSVLTPGILRRIFEGASDGG
ncbi:MAG: AsmA-like C-terminal region-containing protein [Rubrimonas sp.]